MRAAASVRDVLANPIGSYFAGKSFVVWFQPQLAGAFAFDRLHADDLPALRELLVNPVHDAGYDMLCDLGAIEVFDDRAFELLTAAFDARGAELLARVRRFSLVRPGGLAGAGLAGMFYDRVRPFTEAGIFTDRTESLAWLGRTEEDRLEIEQVIAGVHSIPPALRRVRELLMRDRSVTLAKAARAIGTSERSLQRTLEAAGTSFRGELTRTRVRIAESLLTASDDKIEAIAHRLGFASTSAFTSLFGRVVGETPDEFRRRRRSVR